MTMNDNDIIRHLGAVSQIGSDEQVVSSDLARVRKAITEQGHELCKSENLRPLHGGMLKYAAMITAAAVFGLVAHYGLPLDGASVAWADVVEEFGSIDHFSGVLYMREKVSEEPQQIEIWMGSGRRARIRVRDQVLFGKDGKVVGGFDFVKGNKLSEGGFDLKGTRLIEMVGREERFSLNYIVNTMAGMSALEEVTPVVNTDAAISEDLVVFDVRSDISPEWLRIWALKNSRLPIRVRVYDPRGFDQVDLVITYSQPQSDAFYDPDSYGEAIAKSDGRTNRAYALLRDPGGKAQVPQDLFEESGYHMPEIEEAGITEYGAVWVISTNSTNTKPSGRTFDGFRKLQDDLGREYVKLAGRHVNAGDRSIEVFASQDYPFDDRVPGKLILPCEVKEHDPRKKRQLIGTAELTEWQVGSIWPGDRLDRSECDLMLVMAGKHCEKRAFDKCEQIIELVRQAGEYDKLKRKIDRLRLQILMKKAEYKAAADLAMQLWPIELETYTDRGRGSGTYQLEKLVAAVAASGDIDKATELWNELKNTEPDFSHLSKQWQKQEKESLKRQFEKPEQLVSRLRPLLSVEKINRIVGFDVRKHDSLKGYGYRTDAQIAKALAATTYVEKLSIHYNTHPLPERMELIEGSKELQATMSPGSVFSLRGLPGHDGYYVWPVNSSLEHIMTWGAKFSQRIYPRGMIKIGIADDIDDEAIKKTIRADLIYHEDVKVKERFMYVAEVYLEKYGLELVRRDGAVRKVLVAKYDGRELKDYKEVTGFSDGDVRGKPGAVTDRAHYGFDMSYLLRDLAVRQNQGIQHDDKKVVIIDETDISGRVSSISRNWVGEDGLRLAFEWFEEEFGVTFHEEERVMPIWEVRMKQ